MRTEYEANQALANPLNSAHARELAKWAAVLARPEVKRTARPAARKPVGVLARLFNI